MSEFFDKPSGGPGRGIWPTSVSRKCVNRSGAPYEKGDLCVLDMAASSTEVSTANSNSYKGGDDTVFDTLIDAVAGDVTDGAMFGIVIEDGGIADNAVGDVQFFGVVDEAFVFASSGDTIIPGTRLTGGPGVAGAADHDLVAGTSLAIDNGDIVLGRYIDASSTASTHVLKRVFFNGFALTVTVAS